MTLATSRRARRAGSLGAAVSLFAGVLLVAAPSTAAPSFDVFTATPSAVVVGDDFELEWDVTDVETVLTASGAWSGPRDPSGSETIETDEPGTFTYTLSGNDTGGDPGSDSVEVTVYADPGEVTFPDACTVVIPENDFATYEADYGDEFVEELDADTYTDGYFANGGDAVTIRAIADAPYAFAPDAVTSWEVNQSDECEEDEGPEVGPDLVRTDVSCETVEFTNITDDNLTVVYGGEQEMREDGSFELAPGASRTITTERDELLYYAVSTSDDFSVRIIDVPQGCADGDVSDGNGSDHPTVAPAAGAVS
jgi:hypothetical protein